jgi:hypothetical protein
MIDQRKKKKKEKKRKRKKTNHLHSILQQSFNPRINLLSHGRGHLSTGVQRKSSLSRLIEKMEKKKIQKKVEVLFD